LQAHLSPQPHFVAQLQGWHEHCLLEHLVVISSLLVVIRNSDAGGLCEFLLGTNVKVVAF
jgi:hypothetical protein